MADVYVTAGAKVYIGPAMAPGASDFVLADFETSPPKSWVQIGMVETIGSFGDTAQSVTFNAVGRRRVIKKKGSRDAGQMDLVMGIDPSDTGQAALRAAEATDFDYAFKVEFNDKTSASGAANSLRYFVGQVLTAAEQLDGADNIMKLNCSVGINSNVVRKSRT